MRQVDVTIIGSGFSGSLLGWILSKHGYSVAIYDKSMHPRFALGESSTPLADLLLRRLADDYAIPDLHALSQWGSWKERFPDLGCGKKRGFSYYAHRTGEAFSEPGDMHSCSMLTAASPNDHLSDTHWYRQDVDQWFAQRAQDAGAHLFEGVQLTDIVTSAEGWRYHVCGPDGRLADGESTWIIDASGAAGVMARSLGLDDCSKHLQTRTGAIFGHFENVGAMTDWLAIHQPHALRSDPFNGDDAAQHHILDSGWMWMLRFDSGIASVGWVSPELTDASLTKQALEQRWHSCISSYPTLASMLKDAKLLPFASASATGLGFIPRISRLWSAAGGKGWLMLPSTTGVVDPLHSTGIAHSLHGVRQIARLLCGQALKPGEEEINSYSRDTLAQVQWIDQLVHTCYLAQKVGFAEFAAACSLYFIAAIHSERQIADCDTESTARREGFLQHKSTDLREVVSWFRQNLAHGPSPGLFDGLRRRLEPWNDVGLLEESSDNRFAHTLAPK